MSGEHSRLLSTGNSSQNSKAGRQNKHYTDQSLAAQLILTEGLEEDDSQVT